MFYDLAKPFEELDAEVERELLTLAMALARQIVRRELKTDPTQIIGIIREAISALPVAAREVRVHLHPEDAAVVRQNLAPTESERAWVIIEDPVMARGGCQITTATSRIDARLETRLGAILSELLGTERQSATPRGGAAMSGAAVRERQQRWIAALVRARERMANVAEIVVEGTLNRMVGMTLEAVGCEAAVGGRCLVDTAEGRQIEAEVVGFSGDKLFLMPTGRHSRHHARRARRSDAQCDGGRRGRCACSAACWTVPGGRSTGSANCIAPTACR